MSRQPHDLARSCHYIQPPRARRSADLYLRAQDYRGHAIAGSGDKRICRHDDVEHETPGQVQLQGYKTRNTSGNGTAESHVLHRWLRPKGAKVELGSLEILSVQAGNQRTTAAEGGRRKPQTGDTTLHPKAPSTLIVDIWT